MPETLGKFLPLILLNGQVFLIYWAIKDGFMFSECFQLWKLNLRCGRISIVEELNIQHDQ